jgi:TPR repeat protein
MSGCNNLGALYAQGNGVPRDLERARDLYGEACAGGEEYGCTNLDDLDREAGYEADPGDEEGYEDYEE